MIPVLYSFFGNSTVKVLILCYLYYSLHLCVIIKFPISALRYYVQWNELCFPRNYCNKSNIIGYYLHPLFCNVFDIKVCVRFITICLCSCQKLLHLYRYCLHLFESNLSGLCLRMQKYSCCISILQYSLFFEILKIFRLKKVALTQR